MIDMVSPLQLQYLQLIHCDALSRRDLCRLLSRFGSIAGIKAADPQELIEAGITEQQRHQLLESFERHSPDSERITRTLGWLNEDQEQRHLICFEQPEYPDLLKEIACPPVMLFVAGDVSCLNMPQLAIVGSRRSSNNGEQTAAWLAGELARRGFCVTSGLAAGIDSFAHSGALANNGRTIAVLGTGIDRVYPQRNRRLAEQVSGSGALVSEFAIGTPPVAGNFPQRNRIIAGLSLGVIVVEATIRSGSLITARLAMESNREVFAVPGSIHNVLSKGSHYLLKQGATLVESAQDIVEQLGEMLAYTEMEFRKQKINVKRRFWLSIKYLGLWILLLIMSLSILIFFNQIFILVIMMLVIMALLALLIYRNNKKKLIRTEFMILVMGLIITMSII